MMTSAVGAAQSLPRGRDRIVSPLRGWTRFLPFPRADALGYLLVAPTALGHLDHGGIDRPDSQLKRRSFWRGGCLKRISASLTMAAAMAVSFPPVSRADEDPAKALQAEFQSAKASLATGDLPSAEKHYLDTVVLGLRQLAQLSLSEGQTDQAAGYLDSALKLKPDDSETQVATASVLFRKGEVGKAKALLKSVVAKEPNHARARGLLGRIYVFEGDPEHAIEELRASINLHDDFETSYFLGLAFLTAKKLPEASAL